jgi:hypothetical protein
MRSLQHRRRVSILKINNLPSKFLPPAETRQVAMTVQYLRIIIS